MTYAKKVQITQRILSVLSDGTQQSDKPDIAFYRDILIYNIIDLMYRL